MKKAITGILCSLLVLVLGFFGALSSVADTTISEWVKVQDVLSFNKVTTSDGYMSLCLDQYPVVAIKQAKYVLVWTESALSEAEEGAMASNLAAFDGSIAAVGKDIAFYSGEGQLAKPDFPINVNSFGEYIFEKISDVWYLRIKLSQDSKLDKVSHLVLGVGGGTTTTMPSTTTSLSTVTTMTTQPTTTTTTSEPTTNHFGNDDHDRDYDNDYDHTTDYYYNYNV